MAIIVVIIFLCILGLGVKGVESMSSHEKWLQTEMKKLVSEDVITEESRQKIEQYYNLKEQERAKKNIGLWVLSVLGALLIGSGIILILAYNWSNFGREARTFIAIIPLILVQCLAGYMIIKNKNSLAWKESIGILWTAMVASSVAIVGQTYNSGGTLEDFLFVCMILTIGILYITQSLSVVTIYLISMLMYIYNLKMVILTSPQISIIWVDVLLAIISILLLVPYYLIQVKKDEPNRNYFLGFITTISAVALWMKINNVFEYSIDFTVVSFMGLFITIYLLTNKREGKSFFNILGILSFFGIIITEYLYTFSSIWENVSMSDIYILIGILILNIVLLGIKFKRKTKFILSEKVLLILANVIQVVYILFVIKLNYVDANDGFYDKLTYVETLAIGLAHFFTLAFVGIVLVFQKEKYALKNLGLYSDLIIIAFLVRALFDPMTVYSMYAVMLSLFIIIESTKKISLKRANFGLIMLLILSIRWFFNEEASLLIRGILFIGVGILFFGINTFLLKKKKEREVLQNENK